jgi:hypothetical protein
MTIKRMYSLPYCTITLQGLSNDVDSNGKVLEAFPVMSILLNAECYFAHCDQSMSGGKQFLESLVQSVSYYAQEFLSPITYPQSQKSAKAEVELSKLPQQDLHRLTLAAATEEDPTVGKMHIDLTTVQLFDLVEAVDQFLVDNYTLPDIAVPLRSLSRRLWHPEAPLAKRSIPALLGISSLSLAAIAFFLIPAPLPKPVETTSSNNTSQTTTPSPNTTPGNSPTPAPTATSTATPAPTPTTPNSPIPSPKAEDLEKLLTSTPEITDAAQLRLLQKTVYDKVSQFWQNRDTLIEDSTYQVGVLQDGSLVAYKPVDQASSNGVAKTPLPGMLSAAGLSTLSSSGSTVPIAQFRVVFTKRGVLQISPWRGYSESSSSTTPEITASEKLADLNQRLVQTLRDSWKTTPNYPADLSYRVSLTEQGKIVDFEPMNQPAFDYVDQTPLRGLKANTNPTDILNQPTGKFQVVFKANGVLEVSPVRGF